MRSFGVPLLRIIRLIVEERGFAVYASVLFIVSVVSGFTLDIGIETTQILLLMIFTLLATLYTYHNIHEDYARSDTQYSDDVQTLIEGAVQWFSISVYVGMITLIASLLSFNILYNVLSVFYHLLAFIAVGYIVFVFLEWISKRKHV